MRIEDWRKRINEVDHQLVRLLNVRAQIAIEIGRSKSEAGMEIHDPARECEVLTRALRENPGVLSGQAVEHLFREIVRESRRAALQAVASPGGAEAPGVTDPEARKAQP
jgi:chorismate mutase